jgi:hypothetical protein
MTGAERAKRYRERKAQGERPVRWRKPADRRSAPQRWAAAIDELNDILDQWEAWREAMPESLTMTPTAEKLDEALNLRDLVTELGNFEPPRGFGPLRHGVQWHLRGRPAHSQKSGF